jgi:hypothetical protein
MAAQHFVSPSVAVAGGVTTSAATQAASLVLPANGSKDVIPSGIDISHCEAVTCILSAAAGQTITSGTMRCYVMMPTNATGNAEADVTSLRWMKYPQLDYTLAGGSRDEPIGDKYTPTGVGRIIWLPDAVVFSGGASCQLTHCARRRRG